MFSVSLCLNCGRFCFCERPYLVTVTADAHEEVVWFDVSVDEVLCVHVLNSADHLQIEQHKDQ